MSDKKIRVAIIGVGNCASSLVQGVYYYQDARDGDIIPGIMHANLGGYRIRDIEFSAAIDIDVEKVGKDLSQAIWSGQNNTVRFAEVPHMNVSVSRGMTHDGLDRTCRRRSPKRPAQLITSSNCSRTPRLTSW